MRVVSYLCAHALAAAVLGACGGAATSQPPVAATPVTEQDSGAPVLEVVAELDVAPGNLTVTPSGDIVMSLHQFYQPKVPVMRMPPGGTPVPFASAANLASVLGIQSDRNGVVWMLDNAMAVQGAKPRLVAWDVARDQPVIDIDLSAATLPDSFINDLAVDIDNQAVYIADPVGPRSALIVVDLAKKSARRVLEGHVSVVPEEVDVVVDGKPVELVGEGGKLVRPRIGVNPIIADAKNEWVYFGAMNGRALYRVRSSDLRDASLTAEQLGARVETWAGKPVCDGISMDTEGNIYISELGANTIGVIGSDRQYRQLITDARLSWPDAFSYGPDGFMYVAVNQLHRSAPLHGGTLAAKPPFLIVRFRPLAAGTVGR